MAVAPARRPRGAAPIYEGTRIPYPTPSVLKTSPELLATGDVMTINFGPEPPVDARRAPPRSSTSTART